MLLFDGKSCIDVDECQALENVCSGGDCRNTPGSFSCICSGGLMMGPDASSCLDLDECIIEPEVINTRNYFFISKNICRFARMENASIYLVPTSVSVMTASLSKTVSRRAALMMTSVLLICIIVIRSRSVRITMVPMIASAERDSLETDSTVKTSMSVSVTMEDVIRMLSASILTEVTGVCATLASLEMVSLVWILTSVLKILHSVLTETVSTILGHSGAEKKQKL